MKTKIKIRRHLLSLSIWSFTILTISCERQFNEDEEVNISLVEEFEKAIESKDIQTMAKCLAEDYVGFGPSQKNGTTKMEALQNLEERMATLYEKVDFLESRYFPILITDGPYKGSWISNWAELEITFKYRDKPIRIWANTMYKIKNNKITTSYTLYNEADAFRQLGFIFMDVD